MSDPCEAGRCSHIACRPSDVDSTPAQRLELIRASIRAESVSYGELAELQSLAEHIEPGDLELAEWAGLPEGDPLEGDERPLPYVGDTLTIWFPGGSPYGVGGEVTQVTGSLVTLDHTDTYDLELASEWRVRPRA